MNIKVMISNGVHNREEIISTTDLDVSESEWEMMTDNSKTELVIEWAVHKGFNVDFEEVSNAAV